MSFTVMSDIKFETNNYIEGVREEYDGVIEEEVEEDDNAMEEILKIWEEL